MGARVGYRRTGERRYLTRYFHIRDTLTFLAHTSSSQWQQPMQAIAPDPNAMSIRALKEEAASFRINTTGMLEKKELVKAVTDARAEAAEDEKFWQEVEDGINHDEDEDDDEDDDEEDDDDDEDDDDEEDGNDSDPEATKDLFACIDDRVRAAPNARSTLGGIDKDVEEKKRKREKDAQDRAERKASLRKRSSTRS